jgi:translation initiation factor IF-2
LDFIYEPSEEIEKLYRKTLEKMKEAEVVDKAKKQGIVTDISDFRNRNPKDIA